MAANLLTWVNIKPDLSYLCVCGELPVTPADVRHICKFIHRKSVRGGRHWRAFLRGMMQPHKLANWQIDYDVDVDEDGNPLTIRHCFYSCK